MLIVEIVGARWFFNILHYNIVIFASACAVFCRADQVLCGMCDIRAYVQAHKIAHEKSIIFRTKSEHETRREMRSCTRVLYVFYIITCANVCAVYVLNPYIIYLSLKNRHVKTILTVFLETLKRTYPVALHFHTKSTILL